MQNQTSSTRPRTATAARRANARLRFPFFCVVLAAFAWTGLSAHAADVLDLGGTSTCVLDTARGAKCWGNDNFAQLGDGTTGPSRNTAGGVLGLSSNVAMIAGGGQHSCAVTGAGALLCWGLDDQGQLGDGTIGEPMINNTDPVPSSPIGLGSGIRSAGAGAFHTCAITVAGGLKCWGANNTSQLGNGVEGVNSPTPTDVPGLTSGVAAVASGQFHTCALTTTGGVKCWGNDTHGQLGDGTAGLPNRLTPVDVVGLTSGVVEIVAGQVHTCALTAAGGVKCWGNDNHGQLGDGAVGPASTPSPTPTDVQGLTSGVIAITGHGGESACALMATGIVKCWGRDQAGQLGDGVVDPSRGNPVDVIGLSGIVAVSQTQFHACALDAAGTVKCWGSSTFGQVGDGVAFGSGNYPTPQTVSGTYFSATAGTGLASGPALPAPPAGSVEVGTSVDTGPGIVAIGSPGAIIAGMASGEILLYSGGLLGAPPPAAKDASAAKGLEFGLARLQLPIPQTGDRVGEGGVVVDRLGTRVVVGAPGYLGTGAVLVFERPIGGWTGTINPTQTLRPANPAIGDEFGASVTMTNAGTVIAGAPGAAVVGLLDAGKAFVLRPSGNTLQFGETLTAPLPQAEAQFGASLAGQGAVLVVGMPGQDAGGNNESGAVASFREATRGQPYGFNELVTSATPSIGDKFGAAVAIDDGLVVAGAPGRDATAAADAGAALVFEQASTGSLQPVAVLADATPDAGAALGSAVDVQQGTIAAGAPLDDIGANEDQGTIAVYVPAAPEVSPSGTLVPSGTLFDALGGAGDKYGTAFKLGARFAAAGAPFAESTAQAQAAKAPTGGGGTGEALLYTTDRVFRDGLEAIRGAEDGCAVPNLAIPDNNQTGIASQLTVPATGNARDVDVLVQIAHGRVIDLSISLTHLPTATTVQLYAPSLQSPTCLVAEMEAQFSDEAEGGFANDTCNATPPAVDGVRIPADWLLRFQGAARAGPWRLDVVDRAAGNTGTLELWCVNAR